MTSRRALLQDLKNKRFDPVYLFFGEESYLISELVSALAAAFLGDKAAYGLEKMEGRGLSPEVILGKLNNTGLFSPRKVIVIDELPHLVPHRKKPSDQQDEESGNDDPGAAVYSELVKTIVQEKNDQGPRNILIFTCASVDRRKKIYKQIAANGAVVQCNPLRGKDLAGWLVARSAALGKKIEKPAVESLLLSGNHSLDFLSRELEKYCAYLGTEEETITLGTVEALFAGDLQSDVFKMADALAGGNADGARRSLEALLRRKEQPLLVFYMLVRHYRLLLQVKSLQDGILPPNEYASILGIHPYVAGKLQEQAVLYRQEALEDVMHILQDIDWKIKTGYLEPTLALWLALGRVDNRQLLMSGL